MIFNWHFKIKMIKLDINSNTISNKKERLSYHQVIAKIEFMEKKKERNLE
jgi:hypothetical protein